MIKSKKKEPKCNEVQNPADKILSNSDILLLIVEFVEDKDLLSFLLVTKDLKSPQNFRLKNQLTPL